MGKMKEDIWKYVKFAPGVPGDIFCKYCGNNYLLKEHKQGCEGPAKEK